MAKRRNKKDPWVEIAVSISGLVGFGAFFAVMNTIPLNELSSSPMMWVALGAGGGAAILSAMLLALLLRFFRRTPTQEKSFNFEAQPQAAKYAKRAKHAQATAFEHEVAHLIQQLTGKQTQVVGGAGDGGIDIKVYEGKRLIGIVQCKHLAANKAVYPSHIRELNTVKHQQQVNIAYLVTTGYFSADSQQLAQELGVRLIDGETLQKLRGKIASKTGKQLTQSDMLERE